MRYSNFFALILTLSFCTFCKERNKTNLLKDNIKYENKDEITDRGPKSITRVIKQDRKGNIWIAAFDGMFRYDGKSFTNVTSTVSSARFFCVLEDRSGNFWFGSVGSGVYYYDGISFRNFTTKDGLASDRVGCIYEDKSGNIWFGTEGGVSRYDGKSLTFNPDKTGKSFQNFTTKEGLPNNDVNAIIEDKTGKFWFGTHGNACIYDGKTFNTLIHNGKPFTNVRSIIEDKKGNTWLGGNDGLWRYDSTFTNFTQKFIGYIIEDKNGNIWTSSTKIDGKDWTLSRYDEKSLSGKQPIVTEIYKVNTGMICGILEANDGSVWFGDSYGVNRYDGNTIYDFKSKEGQK